MEIEGEIEKFRPSISNNIDKRQERKRENRRGKRVNRRK